MEPSKAYKYIMREWNAGNMGKYWRPKIWFNSD